MMKRFDHRTVIVTGGARGMGASHARGFVAEGANVVIADVLEQEARTDTEFVLGSAVPHKHDLVLGSHSVHTTPAALRDAQAHISAIRTRLVQEGRL